MKCDNSYTIDDSDNVDDDDVIAEKVLINNMTEDELRSESMVMKNISKYYGHFCAVNKVSVSIKR